MTTYQQPWYEHGPLQVSANGHYLEHADGTGFFFLGDTAWYLNRLTPADLERYLHNRASKGFNVILFTVAQYGNPNHAGERVFLGDGLPWSSVTPNEAYWSHVDHIVKRAQTYGLYVGILPWWGRNANASSGQLFTDPDRHNFEYGQLLGRRYRDEPNVIWVGSGEYHTPYYWQYPLPKLHIARLVHVVEGIRAGDGGQHLITMHPLSFMSSSEEFHDADWLDFNMVQSHVLQSYICPLIRGDWHRAPPKPTLLAEGWYEEELENLTKFGDMKKVGDYDPAWIQRYQAYWAVFSGSIGFVYGHRNLWTMSAMGSAWPTARTEIPGVAEPAALDAPSSAHLHHLRTLLASKLFQMSVPDQSLLSLNTRGTDGTLAPDLRCALRSADGSWAMVYTTRGVPFRLAMNKLAVGMAQAFWFNPRSGEWHDDDGNHASKIPFATNIPSGPSASDRYFYPPGERVDSNDWVLVLEIRIKP